MRAVCITNMSDDEGIVLVHVRLCEMSIITMRVYGKRQDYEGIMLECLSQSP